MKTKMMALSVIAAVAAAPAVQACSNVIWDSSQGTVVTRTMDWMGSSQPTLKTIRAGATRNLHGLESGNDYRVEKDILAVESFGLVTEGVNASGFQVSVQFYRNMSMAAAQPGEVSQLELAAYLLAQADSVEEALSLVATLKVGRVALPSLAEAPAGHYIMSDRSGDRALLQYDPDGLKIYRGADAKVVTNNPSQAEHLDLWQTKKDEIEAAGGFDSTINLGAGNTQASQRFIFSNYFASQLTQASSPLQAMMAVEGTTFKVPQQAAYKLGDKMTIYATEYSITYNLDHGDVVFKYTGESAWTQQSWNYRDLLASKQAINRPLYQ